jgi:hypothetical protein
MADAEHVPMYDAPKEEPKNYPQKFVYPSERTLPNVPDKEKK